MTRSEVYVRVAAALYAAHRTDPHPSSIEKDVARTMESTDQMVDAIMSKLADVAAAEFEAKTRSETKGKK